MLQRKSNVVTLRLTPSQMEKLKQLGSKSGVSQSAVIRSMIDGYQLTELPNADLQELLKQLLKIGANLNQIAWKANSLGLLDSDYYHQQAEELQHLRMELLQLFLPRKEV